MVRLIIDCERIKHDIAIDLFKDVKDLVKSHQAGKYVDIFIETPPKVK